MFDSNNYFDRFHLELHFSPGAYHSIRNKQYPSGFGFNPSDSEVSLSFFSPIY